MAREILLERVDQVWRSPSCSPPSAGGTLRCWSFTTVESHAAEQIASLEPPPDVSVSTSPDHQTLDSLPTPVSGGGR